MRILLLLIVLFSGCAFECNCGNPNCGPRCKNQCDGQRCFPGEPCCEKCTCNK